MSATTKPQQFINNADVINCNNNTYSNNKNNNCWKLEDFTLFKKCGEITISSDKQCLGFSCIFCNGICFQLDIFKIHIQQEHSQDIKDLYYGSNMTLYYDEPSISNCTNEYDKTNKINWNEVTAQNEIVLPTLLPKTTLNIAKITTTQTTTTNTAKATTLGAAATTTRTATTTATPTATNTMTTLATLLSQVDFDFEMENRNDLEMENIQELVYIMDDSNSVLNMEGVEETIEPFQIQTDSDTTTPTTATETTTTITGTIATTTMKTRAQEKGCDMETLITHDARSVERSDVDIDIDVGNSSDLIPPIFVKEFAMDALPQIPARVAAHDRQIVTYLLEAYKNNAKLWNPNHPEYKYNAPRSVFNELAVPLARDKNVSLSGEDIFGILNGLRSRFRRELTKMKRNETKEKSSLWYFDEMEFLRGVIESKRAEREIKNRHKNISNINLSIDEAMQSDKPTKTVLTKEHLNSLLEAFKTKEALWNPEDISFQTCDKLRLYEEISTQLMKENNIEMCPNTCKLEMEKLITRYRKELNALQQRKGLHIPKLWCFDQMDFLQKIFEVEFQKRKRRKKGIISICSRTRLNEADSIVFEKLEDQIRFIEIYEAHPALWSSDHPDFRSVKYRGEALKSVLAQFEQTFNIQIDAEELEKTIFTFRKSFSSEKLKRIKNNAYDDTRRRSHSTNNMPPEIYAKLSQFLCANIGPFRCETCQMIIKSLDQYKMHKAAHDGTMPFICVICSKGFQVPGNLAIHIRRHKRDFPYTCEQCKKSFATSTEVTIHQRVHTGARPYICDLCGKSFKTWSFFDIHRRVHLNQSTFLCPICDKGFYEKNRYTAHMNGHLNIRKHCCKVCGKSFTTFCNLKKHSELHLPIRKYKCDTCGTRFAQFASLRWHKRRKHLHTADYDEDTLEQ